MNWSPASGTPVCGRGTVRREEEGAGHGLGIGQAGATCICTCICIVSHLYS